LGGRRGVDLGGWKEALDFCCGNAGIDACFPHGIRRLNLARGGKFEQLGGGEGTELFGIVFVEPLVRHERSPSKQTSR
jgi:hypothetical protein